MNGDDLPTGVFVGLGTKVSGTQLDFRQGGMEPTERTLDFTIQGSGFFAVQVEDGLGERIRAHQGRQLRLNANRELVLANSNGRRLVPAVTIPEDVPEENITVTADGIVSFIQRTNPRSRQLELTIFPTLLGSSPWVRICSWKPPPAVKPSTPRRPKMVRGTFCRALKLPTWTPPKNSST